MISAALPTVIGEFGTKPQLAFTSGTAPTGLQVSVLRQGNGDPVRSGHEIEVNYLGQVWGGQIFDNSYDRRQPLAFPIGVGMVIGGWDDSLVGQRVGSRVLLSIPPEHGYGHRGVPQAGIGGGDTLVFVIDILDAR